MIVWHFAVCSKIYVWNTLRDSMPTCNSSVFSDLLFQFIALQILHFLRFILWNWWCFFERKYYSCFNKLWPDLRKTHVSIHVQYNKYSAKGQIGFGCIIHWNRYRFLPTNLQISILGFEHLDLGFVSDLKNLCLKDFRICPCFTSY